MAEPVSPAAQGTPTAAYAAPAAADEQEAPAVEETEPAPSEEVTASTLLSALAAAQVSGVSDLTPLTAYLDLLAGSSAAEREVADRFGAVQVHAFSRSLSPLLTPVEASARRAG